MGTQYAQDSKLDSCATGCVSYILLEGAQYTGSILWLHIVSVGARMFQSAEGMFSMKLWRHFKWFPSRNLDLVSKSTKDSCIRNFGLVQEAQIMNLYSKTQTNQGILSFFLTLKFKGSDLC